jgi:hypothetical protein
MYGYTKVNDTYSLSKQTLLIQYLHLKKTGAFACAEKLARKEETDM